MIKLPPCKACEKQGCGSYHDKCESYQAWYKEQYRIKREFSEFKAREHSLSRKRRSRWKK